MQVLDSVDDKVVLELEKHSQAARIKKLIFCVCKNYWENDINLIDTIYLKHLIEELKELNSTQEKLNNSIYQIVNLLNRKEVYSSVANTIVTQVGKLYSSSSDKLSKQTNGIGIDRSRDTKQAIESTKTEQKPVKNTSILLEQISINLAKDINSERIKKIIFALCKNRWENDSTIIEKTTLSNLIKELYQQNSTLEELEKSLYNLVKTLNRQSLYLLIAQKIIAEMECLYNNERVKAKPVNAQVKGKKISKETSLIADFSKQTYLFDELFKPSEHLEEANTPEVSNESIERQTDIKSSQQVEQQINTYDPFDLRLEVMKYGNPLRVKILVFSLTYHLFDSSGKDWSLLQTCTLDDLLSKLLHIYPTIIELEEQIYAIAKTLKDSDEYLQPAGAIVQSMRPIYANK